MPFVASKCLTRTTGRLVLVILCMLAVSSTRASAVETEVRDFAIEVDGKACGHYLMTITRHDKETLSMQAEAKLKVKAWLVTVEYSFSGIEYWRNGRLIEMTAKCNDDGTKYDVVAKANGQELRLTVNGKQRDCRGDVWTTSYWMLPDKRFFNAAVPLLDADCGKEYGAQLQYVGVKEVNVGGQIQNCYHFRVSGGPNSPVELFYDGQHRLARQEFTEQGKRVVFNLRSVVKKGG
jgi:hypothetical protein